MNRESEIQIRALFLSLYTQFYLNEVTLNKCRERLLEASLKAVISERLDRILLLKKGIGELPINLTDLYFAAVILACLILGREEEAQIQKEDYSHVNFNNPVLSAQLAKAIEEFNYIMKKK